MIVKLRPLEISGRVRVTAGVSLGAIGLAALVGVAPISTAFAGSDPVLPGSDMAAELGAAGVSAGTSGRLSGRRMAPDASVQHLTYVPERPFRELIARVGEDGGLEKSLRRAGVSAGDAKAASAAVKAASGVAVPAGTSVSVRLGEAGANGGRPLTHLKLRARFDLDVSVEREGNRFLVTRQPIAVRADPKRIRGRAGNGLYWAMRSAGISARAAQDYLKAISAKADVGDVGPGDWFDVVIEHRRSAAGEETAGPLLYAALDRASGDDVTLMNWTVRGKADWLDATAMDGEAEGMMWPVAARISSGFGMRRHPILRYKRMHAGIDFAAGHGTPIVAAADGRVARAGWAGGYGKQVRLAHEDGLSTSYSHMSGIAVAPGTMVRQGEVIGYVGSTGLSTGAHLHYEVRQNGQPIDPNNVRMVRRPLLDAAEMKRFEARLEQYRKLPTA